MTTDDRTPGGGRPADHFADAEIWSGEGRSGPRRPPRPRGEDRTSRTRRRTTEAGLPDGSRRSPIPAGPRAYDDRPIEPPYYEDVDEEPVVPEPYPDHTDDDHDGYHDYVDLPRESRFPRWIAALLVVALIVGSVVGIGRWWYGRQVDPPGPPGAAIAVQVPAGSSTSAIGSLLAKRGVVTNATLFNFYVSRKGAGPFKAGSYRFQKSSSFAEAIDRLDAGPGKAIAAQTTKVTIPEGYTLAKTLERIHEKVPRLSVADLQAALDQGKVPSKLKPEGTTSYEGLLFPATYEVGDDTTAQQVLTTMAASMETHVDQLDLAVTQSDIKDHWGLNVTAYDLLKVASMIQYEAAGEQDAAKIGTVTYNRLQKRMALGYDSTSIYEAGLTGKDPQKIDYQVDTPYNTRQHLGLPPTPIAMPGQYALDGAFKPADGPWLYFVLTNTKEVTFATTYQEFQRAKVLCQQRNLGCG